MDMKKHYKLYKSGKQWITAAIATITITAGLLLGISGGVKADSTTTPIASVSNQNVEINDNHNQNNTNSNELQGTISESQDKEDQSIDQSGNTPISTFTVSKSASNAAFASSQPVEQQKNGWIKNGQGQMEYYQNGVRLSGRQYVNLPTIPATYVQGDTNWYLMNDGVAQSGVQKWAGTYYYFNPSTYLRVDNDYRQSQWGDWYMFGKDGRIVTGLYKYKGNIYYANPNTYLRETNKYITTKQGKMLLGSDGAALSGVQNVNGKFYYFDPETHLQANKKNYVQSQWGDWYLIGDNGQVLSGVQKWAGTYYYFDPTTYLRVDNDYRQSQWGLWYMFGHDGRIVTKVYPWAGSYYYFDPNTYLKVTNDYRQSQWGDWYLFGNDGRVMSGVQKWAGTYYYFDPTTYLRVDDDYRQSQWGLKYMFGKDGRIATGLYKWDKNNQWYYFDPSTYLAVTNNYIKVNDGNWYLFTADGTAASGVQKWAGTYYYFDPITHLRVDNDYRQSQWGDWYMFGNDGRIVTGLKKWQGSLYYFDPVTYLKVANKWIGNRYFGADGRMVTNQSIVINGSGYTFNSKGEVTSISDIGEIRNKIAKNIADLLTKQGVTDVKYDWTSQDHNYQEVALHDIAQEVAQGDTNADKEVIAQKLELNDLLKGKVLAIYTTAYSNADLKKTATNFLNSYDFKNINDSVIGVGADATNNKIVIILFKPGESTAKQTISSEVTATVLNTFKNAGVNVDVTNGLIKGSKIGAEDLGPALTSLSSRLLNGEKGRTISTDTLKTIFAALPGNSSALEGIKTYYHGTDPYHYQFWLNGQSSDDKMNNFLKLNQGAKYGDQLKVNYNATLVYGAEIGTETPAVDETPASEKNADQIQLAYKTGGETGLRFDRVTVEKIPGMTNDMIRGVDISSYQSLLNAGVKFYDFNGQEASLFKVLKDSGVNWIRLRVWNDPYNASGNPYAGGDSNEENLIKLATEATQNGLKLLVGFQYSDFWADPAQQILPKAWKQLSTSDISKEVYLYTSKVLNDLEKAGAKVNMVQIGNEITNGAFGLYTGRNGGGDWSSLWETADGDQVAKYLEAGSSAVRKADPTIKIAIQLETPEINKYRGIMTVLKKNNVDYDYLGTSYYPFWSTKQGNGWYDNIDLGYGASTPTNLEAIEKMAWKEFGKKTVILESGWLNNTNDADGTHNSVGEDNNTTNIDRYSADPQGQVDAIADMYKAIIAEKGLGAFYWEPAWIPVKAGWDNWQYNRDISGIYGTGWASQYAKGYSPDSVLYYKGQPAWGGSSWDNISLFDDHGHPLQSLMMFKGFLTGYQSPANVTSIITPKLIKLYGAEGVSLRNGLQLGQTLNLKNFLNKDGQFLLNGVENTAISEASLKAIFNDLQDGLKSESYSDDQGNTYHYEFWLDGNTIAEKLANFLAANKSTKYGNPLTVNYSATLVQNKKNVTVVTSPIKVTISKVWGLDGVTIAQPLSEGDSLPPEDLKQIKTVANKILTGAKGDAITSEIFSNLSKSLPGVTEALSGTKIYTTADGNQYHYEYWLTTQNIAWANKNAKYGDPINLTYSASLKWIDPKVK